MSTGYKINEGDELYYLTFQIVGWVDIFTRKAYPVGGDTKTSGFSYYASDGRLQTETLPDGTTKTHKYTYNTEEINLNTGEKYSKTYDAAGLLTTATDPGGTISYQYDGSWKPKTITAPGGTTTMEYDAVTGQQSKLVDPDAGTTLYDYNLFGELSTQTDARNKVTKMDYDVLGRVKTKTVDWSSNHLYLRSGYAGIGHAFQHFQKWCDNLLCL